MTKNKTIEYLTQYCDECFGEGEVSSCCGSTVDGNRCLQCGKFCHVEVCPNCDGRGFNEFRVGDNVEIFVCCWSPEYLKDTLYKPKKIGDTKTFRGKIISIVDDYHVNVKLRSKTLKIRIDELTQV